jgi:threonine/homoserine/homoserine lactone efflux protein
MQAQAGIQKAAQQHQEEIAYWQAIAAGRTPPLGNPYTALYGLAPYSPVIQSKDPGTNLSQLVTQGDTMVQLTQQLVKNTSMVMV